jgi:poly-gamma-glutamate synthesis protein (capsule biosynthesis protein)
MKICVAGDLFISNSFIDKIMIDKSVQDLFADVDIRIVNLEAPITIEDRKNRIIKTGVYLQNCEQAVIPILKSLKINLVTLANNHILDYGPKGLTDTLEVLEANNIAYVGAGKNIADASKSYSFEKDQVKVAVLNFAENEWSIANQRRAGANPLDIIENVRQIQIAKASHDKVICIIHGGHEYYNLPSSRMQKQYHFYVDNGADLIIGHHTHCISGYEVYKGTPIYYSLGNLLFTKDSTFEDWYLGLILEIELNDLDVRTKLHLIEQAKGTFDLKFMDNDKKNKTLSRIKMYSEIIANSELLEKSWRSYVDIQAKQYIDYWSPISFIGNRYIRKALRKMGISLINKEGLSLYLNLMRCESHLDLSKEVIKRYLENG